MKRNSGIKGYILIGALVAAALVGLIILKQIDYANLKAFIAAQGTFAPIIFMALMAAAVVISPIPSIPLDIAGGVIFGWFFGGLYAVIGAEIGALIAFMISRTLARPIIEKYIKNEIMLFNEFYKKPLPWMIFISRLLPVFQFDIISYASGLTSIKKWKFALATLLGMIPVTFILSYSGNAIIKLNISLSLLLTIALGLAMYYIPKHIVETNRLRIMK